MNIKTKKSTLIKALISGGLLLSIGGLSLVLMGCSKKKGIGLGGDNDDATNNVDYLFNLDPKLLDHEGKDVNEGNLVLKKDLESLLDETKGYSKNFFSQLDPSFDKSIFLEKVNENGKESTNDVTATFGDIDVYYLNIDNVKAITFDINEKMLSKISKIEDLKNYINFKLFKKQKQTVVSNGEAKSNEAKATTELFIQPINENDKSPTLAFLGKENDNDKEIKDDKDLSNIEKAKIELSKIDCDSSTKDECLGGLLITFKPIEGDKVKTIAVKFVKNDSFKYFGDKKFYENLEKDVQNMVDDHYVKLLKIGDKTLDEYITDSLKDNNFEDIAEKDGDVWKFSSDLFFDGNDKKKNPDSNDAVNDNANAMSAGVMSVRNNNDDDDEKSDLESTNQPQNANEPKDNNDKKKNLDILAVYLKTRLSLTLDKAKSIKHQSLCFDSSSLPKKIDNNDCEYLISFGENNNKHEEMFLSYGKEEIKEWPSEIKLLSNDPIIDNGKFVIKLIVKHLSFDLLSKDIEIKFK